MRVSVDSNDPCHTGPIRGAQICLDGVEQRHVVTADDELGCIKRYKVDEAGEFIVDRVARELVSEVVWGRVEIRLPAGLNDRLLRKLLG